MKKWIIPFLLASGAFLGCSDETATYRFEVKSDTNWRAVYKQVGSKDATVLLLGTGNRTINITDEPPVCMDANKFVSAGYLEVTAYKHIKKKSAIFRVDSEEDIAQNRGRAEGGVLETGACTQ